MKILVIGSEGNIGKRIVPYFDKYGYDVYCADQIQLIRPKYQVVNILSASDVSILFQDIKPDIVYLLAAMVSRLTCEQSPALTVQTNISGTYNIVQLCKQYNSKLIYFSTSEVYGNIPGLLSECRDCEPNNIYGLTKYMSEQLIKYEVTNGLQAVILRPFMFYDENETLGDHRSVIIRFAEKLINKQPIIVYKNSFRSWMHISDALPILPIINSLKKFDIINIGNSEVFPTSDIANQMCRILGLNYSDYAVECDLPPKMTLNKFPDIRKQHLLYDHPQIPILEGINCVITTVKKRLWIN
jgi:nucleoside-diphosphate-sugar epimerase